ncbi:MAG: zinc ribbon domain-containing protein [Alkalibacterium sp.]
MQWISKLLFYMKGRYGYDELSKVLIFMGLVLSIFSNFTDGLLLNILALASIAYGGLRVLSKEKANRRKELQQYIKLKQTVMSSYRKYRNRWIQRKAFKITKCPNCKQKIRVPRGKNKIRVTCPSCQNKFIKKT